MGALFWDRRRPRLHASPQKRPKLTVQARTPAVPEEGAHWFKGVTEGDGRKRNFPAIASLTHLTN